MSELKVEREVVERVLITYPLKRAGLDAALAYCAEHGYREVRSGPKGVGTGKTSKTEGLVVAERPAPALQPSSAFKPQVAEDAE